MAGDEIDGAGGAPDEFFSKKWYERIAIVSAGAIMNYISAFIIFLFIISIWGLQYQRPVVKLVEKNSPAFVAGLISGDEMVDELKKEIDVEKDFDDSFGVFMVFEDSDEVVGVEWVVGERG